MTPILPQLILSDLRDIAQAWPQVAHAVLLQVQDERLERIVLGPGDWPGLRNRLLGETVIDLAQLAGERAALTAQVARRCDAGELSWPAFGLAEYAQRAVPWLQAQFAGELRALDALVADVAPLAQQARQVYEVLARAGELLAMLEPLRGPVATLRPRAQLAERLRSVGELRTPDRPTWGRELLLAVETLHAAPPAERGLMVSQAVEDIGRHPWLIATKPRSVPL